MRLLYRLVIIIILFCGLNGCCYLCKYCQTTKPPVKKTEFQEKVNPAQSQYFVNYDNYTYKHRNGVRDKAVETFMVFDNSKVDPPPVRSKPKTYINVPARRFYRNNVKSKDKIISSAAVFPSSGSGIKQNITVYFDLNSYRIRTAGLEKLKAFAEWHKGKPVSVVGYTCWRGSQKYNDILAERRARSVATYLRGKNVIITSVRGKGKVNYKSRTNISVNRRVEVTSCLKKSS